MFTAGMRTSEFWLSLLAAILVWLGPHVGIDFPTEALYAVGAYAISRGFAKRQVV